MHFCQSFPEVFRYCRYNYYIKNTIIRAVRKICVSVVPIHCLSYVSVSNKLMKKVLTNSRRFTGEHLFLN